MGDILSSANKQVQKSKIMAVMDLSSTLLVNHCATHGLPGNIEDAKDLVNRCHVLAESFGNLYFDMIEPLL